MTEGEIEKAAQSVVEKIKKLIVCNLMSGLSNILKTELQISPSLADDLAHDTMIEATDQQRNGHDLGTALVLACRQVISEYYRGISIVHRIPTPAPVRSHMVCRRGLVVSIADGDPRSAKVHLVHGN